MRSRTTRKIKIRRGGANESSYSQPFHDFIRAIFRDDEAKVNELIDTGAVNLESEYKYYTYGGTYTGRGTPLGFVMAIPIGNFEHVYKSGEPDSTYFLRKYYFLLKNKGAKNKNAFFQDGIRFNTLSLAVWNDWYSKRQGGIKDVLKDILQDYKEGVPMDEAFLRDLVSQIDELIRMAGFSRPAYMFQGIRDQVYPKYWGTILRTAHSQKMKNALKNVVVQANKATTRRKMKNVVRELSNLPPIPGTGFPGGNVYRSALANWQSHV